MKYLLKNNDDIYTVTDGGLTAVEHTDIDAALFKAYGMDDVPNAEKILALEAPVLLCWGETDFTVRATVTASPPVPQIMASKYIDFDSTISNIKKVTVTGSDDILCRFAFKRAKDKENIWMVWDTASKVWRMAEDDEWNTKGGVEDARGFPEMAGYNIQIRYPTLESFLTGLKVDYINTAMSNMEGIKNA
ncbi:MAG: hypothetical protein NC311_08745 [Muribaculaceae bacterium]|nr:hypothetical protein [Muribaculaceae bacterium]MCM1399861.1 hypothetical protein [Clostridium sp.]MCM1460654.1 hypothetical protein [Bacteroides sp.]